MRYTVTKQRLNILGKIWDGSVAAQVRDLSTYDLNNIGNPRDRDQVEHWICLNCGDFSEIIDFAADFHLGDEHVIHEWADPDNEFLFSDCISPEED